MPPQVAAIRAAAATAAPKAAPKPNGKAGGKAQATPASVPSSAATEKLGAHGAKVKHKRRFCRVEGCEKIVKSQGLCQRHGAKPRLCKVKDCTKQAQGNFDGMCKSHFKEHKRKTTPIPKVDETLAGPPQPLGSSVFDSILPTSVDFFPVNATVKAKMPLVAHLAEGFHGGKPPAWHRNEERKARGLLPVQNPATQLEGWERELVWMEILVLTGVPEVSFRHLARAWGRDKGFHMVLAQFICERHGDVQRKKRKREEELSVEALKRPSIEAPKQLAVAQKLVPRTQQEQQQQLVRLGMSPEEAKTINFAMLSPEKRKKIATLLRKRSGENSDKQAGGPELTDEQLSLIGADVWDDTCYGDSNYNEALAADLFNLTPQESAVLMRRLSVGRQAAADDDSSIYSRSVASGKTLGLASRTGSTDQQQQQPTRLPKRDSSTSLISHNSAQIPNTVAVKQAPDGRTTDQQFELAFSTDEGLKPAAQSSWPPQQQQPQQQQYNGETAQQAKDNLHQNQGLLPQQNSPQEYQTSAPQPASIETYLTQQQSAQPAQSGQFEVSNPTKFDYNHQDFPSQSSQGQEQQKHQAQPDYDPNVPQASEQQQNGYHHQQQGVQQYPPAPQQQPPVQQQYQPTSQHQSYQTSHSPLQQSQQFQPSQQQGQQYGQPGPPAQKQSPQLLAQQQVQHSHQGHLHDPTQGQGSHHRQHSHPDLDVFPPPHSHQNSFSMQGHPQTLHQRQHSQQSMPLHGAPLLTPAYQQQQGTSGQHPGAPQGQSFHHRQHSLQRYSLPQTQVFNGQQLPPPQGQLHAQQNTQLQQPQQVTGYGGQQHETNQQYQNAAGGHHHGALYSSGQDQDAGQHPLLRGISQSRVQIERAIPGLHEYDHRNEHLQAEEDDHTDEDTSKQRNDYGAEIEHEDHDHQDTQRQPEPGNQHVAYEQRSQEPSAAYAYRPGQHIVPGHVGQGQDANAQYGQTSQQWNHFAPAGEAYHPSSTSTQVQGGHHHQHDHHMEPPPQRLQPAYANGQSSVQTQYPGAEQQMQQAQQSQQYGEAQYSGSTPQAQHNTFQASQDYHAPAPAYDPNVAQNMQVASHLNEQYSSHQHPEQSQGQDHSDAQTLQVYDHFAGANTAGYQSQAGADNFPNPIQAPIHQRHPSQHGHEDTHAMMNAFQQESTQVQYQQHQPGNASFHHQTEQGGQVEQNSFATGYDAQQSAQHQPPHYQAQTQDDHEAAKKAMAGFEQDQQQHGHSTGNHSGHGHQNAPDPLHELEQEALFELPYTQLPNDGQQQTTYQQETENNDDAYSQVRVDQSNAHQLEQQACQAQIDQEHYPEQHQGQQSNQDQYQESNQGESDQSQYQQQQEGEGNNQDQYPMANTQEFGQQEQASTYEGYTHIDSNADSHEHGQN